jgi:hypothetical protein
MTIQPPYNIRSARQATLRVKEEEDNTGTAGVSDAAPSKKTEEEEEEVIKQHQQEDVDHDTNKISGKQEC